MGFGNIGLELAKRLHPFGVRIIATKRSWAQNSSQLNGNESKTRRWYFQCLNSYSMGSIPFHKGASDDLVDEKGTHEDIHKYASAADIVVCCLCLNSETVRLLLWLLSSCLWRNDHCRNYVLCITRNSLSIFLISICCLYKITICSLAVH